MLKARMLSFILLLGLIWVFSPSPPASADPALCRVASRAARSDKGARVRWVIGCDKRSEKTTKSKHSATGSSKKRLVRRVDSSLLVVAYTIMCREAREAGLTCTTAPKAGRPVKRAQVRRDLDAIARTLVTRIKLPDPRPLVGPDPVVNEWGMAAVGFPLWLWTAGPGMVTDRVRAFGVRFTLRARWVSTRFEMGDGHSVVCVRMRPYRSGVRPGSRAPDCGYTYGRASLPQGSFLVRATTSWRIGWSALGMSGSMPASFTGTRALPVGELNALIVK